MKIFLVLALLAAWQDGPTRVGTVDVSKIPDGAKNPELKPVVAQIAGELGLNVVLDRGAGVIFADESVADITTAVVRRLAARRIIAKSKDAKEFADARKSPIETADAHGLFDKAAKAHDAKDYKTSVPAFRALVFALYDGADRARVRLAATAAYNAACGGALDGRKDEALDWLEVAVGLGWLDASCECHKIALDHLAADPDLESLRGEARYKEITR